MSRQVGRVHHVVHVVARTGRGGFDPCLILQHAFAFVGWLVYLPITLVYRTLRFVHRHWPRTTRTVLAAGAVTLIAVYNVGANRTLLYAAVVAVVLVGVAVAIRVRDKRDKARRIAAAKRERLPRALADAVNPILGWQPTPIPKPGAPVLVGGNRIPLGQHPSWSIAGWPYEHHKDAGATIVLRFPRGWQGTDTHKGALCAQASRLLGGEWLVTADDVVSCMVTLTRQAAPFVWPKSLHYTELPDPAGDHIPLGMREGGDWFGWTVSTQVPGLLLGGLPGAGKSNLLRVLITGAMRNGHQVDVLENVKSGKDFRALQGPGVTLHTTTDAIVAALADFTAELERRAPLDDRHIDTLPRRILVIDEAAELLAIVRRQGGASAVTRYADNLISIIRHGRGSRMHLVMATQRPGAKTLTGDINSGGELRDLLGFSVGLCDLPDAAADMVFGKDVARSRPRFRQADTGRGAYHDGQWHTVQIAQLDAEHIATLPGMSDRVIPTAAPVPTIPSRVVTGGETQVRQNVSAHARVHKDPERSVSPVSVSPDPLPDAAASADWHGGRPKLFAAVCHSCGKSFRTSTEPGNRGRCPGCRALVTIRPQSSVERVTTELEPTE